MISVSDFLELSVDEARDLYRSMASAPSLKTNAEMLRHAYEERHGVSLVPDAPKAKAVERPTCPKCGSHDVKTSRAVYEQGAGSSTTSGAGVGAAGGGLGVGVGVASGTHVSEAAKLNAPPDNSQAIGCVGVLAMVLVIFIGIWNEMNFFGTIVAGVVAAIVVAGVVAALLKESTKKAADDYDKTWYCMTCGFKFWRGS